MADVPSLQPESGGSGTDEKLGCPVSLSIYGNVLSTLPAGELGFSMPSSLSQRRKTVTRWPRYRSAYSLVEVVAAIALTAATLVPALELVRTGMAQSSETDSRQLLALYAASQIEQRLGIVAMTWSTGSYTGDYASDGHPNLRFDTVCSDNPTSGGITDKLMDIRTTVYLDENQDDTLSTGELRCAYRTKLGNFATYAAQLP